jgi:thiol-disulfide isomerase/thioredoxin
MNRYKLTCLVICLLLSVFACKTEVNTDRFSVEPSNPQPGNNINVYYNPAGTLLQDSKTIEMVYYICAPGAKEAKSAMMQKLNGNWSASVNTKDSSLAVAFKFVSNGNSDSNGDKGYTVMLNDSDDNVLPGAKAALSDLLVTWRDVVGVIRTRVMKTSALNNIKEDIESHPEFRKYYLSTYYYLLKDLKVEDGVKEIVADIKSNSTNKNLSAEELSAMLSYCQEPELQELEAGFRSSLTAKNPKDEYFLREKVRGYSEAANFSQKEKIVSDISKTYTDNEYVSYLQSSLVDEYVKDGKEADAAKYLRASANFIDSSIESYFASQLIEKGINPKTALDFAKSAVEQKEKEIKNGLKSKPANLTKNEWIQQQNQELGRMLGEYGKALMMSGKNMEAIPVLEKSISLIGTENGKINETYSKALLETGDNRKAYTETERFILDGFSTPEMPNCLKTAYIEINGSDSGFDLYLAGINKTAKQKRTAKIKSEMLNKPAPDFTLTDLQGKKVSLKDYRGKSIVIDFWATWCPPCRASFPFLKKLVDSRKDDGSVKFLFINTRDHEQKRNERVAKFLKDNNYPFYVLLDTELDKTNDDFIIPGLPTKLFIDKNGVIKYMMVGWEGEEEKELEKITTILELIK